MMFNIPFQTSTSPWWLWLIVIVLFIVLIILIWWWLSKAKEDEVPGLDEEYESPAPPTPVAADDLALIEGIGPKITGLLNTAGIMTFKQLAETEVARLQQILDEVDLRIADPGSWPEQAKLAAEGKMDELQVLQDSLKGGRKV